MLLPKIVVLLRDTSSIRAVYQSIAELTPHVSFIVVLSPLRHRQLKNFTESLLNVSVLDMSLPDDLYSQMFASQMLLPSVKCTHLLCLDSDCVLNFTQMNLSGGSVFSVQQTHQGLVYHERLLYNITREWSYEECFHLAHLHETISSGITGIRRSNHRDKVPAPMYVAMMIEAQDSGNTTEAYELYKDSYRLCEVVEGRFDLTLKLIDLSMQLCLWEDMHNWVRIATVLKHCTHPYVVCLKYLREHKHMEQLDLFLRVIVGVLDDYNCPALLREFLLCAKSSILPASDLIFKWVLCMCHFSDNGDVYDCMDFFTAKVESLSTTAYNFPEQDGNHASSVSFIQHGDCYVANIRYVNYLLFADGSHKNDGSVRSSNFTVQLDSNLQPITQLQRMEVLSGCQPQTYFQGYEDVRLFTEAGKLHWIACSSEPSQGQKIQQVTGHYNLDTHVLADLQVLDSPTNRRVEKNWIPTRDGKFIYEWSPLIMFKKVGTRMERYSEQATNHLFRYLRGSSNIVTADQYRYCVVHTSEKYRHLVVQLNHNDEVLAFTAPFYFVQKQTEYCLGITVDRGILKCIVSQWDNNPVLVAINLHALVFIPVNSTIKTQTFGVKNEFHSLDSIGF